MKKKRRRKSQCLAEVLDLLEFRKCRNYRRGTKYCKIHKNWKKKRRKFQCVEKVGRKRYPKKVEPGSKYCLSHNISHQHRHWSLNNVIKKGH